MSSYFLLNNVNVSVEYNTIYENEDYYKYFMRNADINKFIMPYGKISNCYGYYDDTNKKIRFIFINTVDIPNGYEQQHIKGISNEQLNFVADALKFNDSEWGVVFISHHALQDNRVLNPDEHEDAYLTPEHGGIPLIGVINAFINNTTYSYTSSVTDWEYNVDIDYTNNASNEVIGMFSGHMHRDGSVVTDSGYAMIQTTSAGNSVGGQNEDGTPIVKKMYTITETSWDLITIDRINKKIYLDRFGGGNSREVTYTT